MAANIATVRRVRRPDHEPFPRSRVAITALGACGFTLLALSVAGDGTSLESAVGHRWWIDRWAIAYRVRHDILADHPPRLRLQPLVSLLSPVAIVAAAAVLALAALAARRVRWACTFASVLAVSVLVRAVLKPLVGRRVPAAAGGTALAFPSGHLAVLGAFLTAVFLATAGAGAVFRAVTGVGLALVAAGFGVLFVLTGNHFATDCAGGLLIGGCVASLADMIGTALERAADDRLSRPAGGASQ